MVHVLLKPGLENFEYNFTSVWDKCSCAVVWGFFDLCSFLRQTIQYHSNSSLCPTSNAEEAEVEWFCEDLQDLLELTPKKDVLFIIGDWNAKVGSQETPGVTQIWPWSTEWSRANANRVLPGEHTGHSKHFLPTTQKTTLDIDITRWSMPKSLYSKMEKLCIVSKKKTGCWLWLWSWAPYCQIQT